MTLDPVESTTYTALTKDIKTAPLAFILGWCADYPDPQNWLSVYWKTGAFGERIGYSNKDLDALMDQADVETRSGQAHGAVRPGAEAADRRRAGGVRVEQRQQLPGQAVGQGHLTTPQDSDFPGSTGRDEHRHRYGRAARRSQRASRARRRFRNRGRDPLLQEKPNQGLHGRRLPMLGRGRNSASVFGGSANYDHLYRRRLLWLVPVLFFVALITFTPDARRARRPMGS